MLNVSLSIAAMVGSAVSAGNAIWKTAGLTPEIRVFCARILGVDERLLHEREIGIALHRPAVWRLRCVVHRFTPAWESAFGFSRCSTTHSAASFVAPSS